MTTIRGAIFFHSTMADCFQRSQPWLAIRHYLPLSSGADVPVFRPAHIIANTPVRVVNLSMGSDDHEDGGVLRPQHETYPACCLSSRQAIMTAT